MNQEPIVEPGRYEARVVRSYVVTTDQGPEAIRIEFDLEEGSRVVGVWPLVGPESEDTGAVLRTLGFDLHREGGDIYAVDGTHLLVGQMASVLVEDQSASREPPRLRVIAVNVSRQDVAPDRFDGLRSASEGGTTMTRLLRLAGEILRVPGVCIGRAETEVVLNLICAAQETAPPDDGGLRQAKNNIELILQHRWMQSEIRELEDQLGPYEGDDWITSDRLAIALALTPLGHVDLTHRGLQLHLHAPPGDEVVIRL